MLAPGAVRCFQIEGFDAARSGNLRHYEVRAAGSCLRFNTSVVRMARPMHYEGTKAREIPAPWSRKESFIILRNKARELIFHGIFNYA